MSIELIADILLSAVSGIFVVIQTYLVYRVDRTRLRLETYMGLAEKSELMIKAETQPGEEEVITLTNRGLIPFDEVEAKIDITFLNKKQEATQFHLEWQRKTILDPNEVAVIPLYEKLRDLLRENGLLSLQEERIGPDPDDVILVSVLLKPFSIILAVELTSEIQGHSKTTRKKFKLYYTYIDEPRPVYDPDYKISIHEHMGEWKA